MIKTNDVGSIGRLHSLYSASFSNTLFNRVRTRPHSIMLSLSLQSLFAASLILTRGSVEDDLTLNSSYYVYLIRGSHFSFVKWVLSTNV